VIIAKLLICIASVFAALSLFCAVTVGRRAPRQSGHFGGPSSQARRASSAPADASYDPLRRSFAGNRMATRDLARLPGQGLRLDICEPPKSAGLALRTDAGSDGSNVPSGPIAVRNLLRGPRT
jgi:hypothetical protein